jgi:hypothetical protein
MPKTGVMTMIAYGFFLGAALPATAYDGRPVPYGLYTPPPAALISPDPRRPPCYASYTRRERDKGIRHWTGLCPPRS